MAKLVKNSKNFKVVKLTREEAKHLGWGINNGVCLCMTCNKPIKGDIYYPIVLNDTMDKECYEKWLKTAINYPEDKKYEDRKFENFSKMLNIEM